MGWANNIHLLLRTYVTLRDCRFSCTGTHGSHYAAAGSLVLAHMGHTMLLQVFLYLHTRVTLREISLALAQERTIQIE